MPYPIPEDEDARLAALAEYGLLDTPAEEALDRIVRLAARIFDTPTALVSLIDRDRQFFKARVGIGRAETSRDTSFCAHGLESAEVLVVPDARLDSRFADNPLVTGPPGIRFYAGAPLISPSGRNLGSLCVVDVKPRPPLSETDVTTLKDLAALVMDQFEARRIETARNIGWTRFERIAETSPDAIICTDVEGVLTFWNRAAEALFGFTADQVLGQGVEMILPDAMRDSHRHRMQHAASGGGTRLVGTTVELVGIRYDGGQIPIELSLSMWPEGKSTGFGAIVRDLTHRKENEANLYRLAHLDHLTDMANRDAFASQLAACVAAGTPLDLMMIDLDEFKVVNEAWGHSRGDHVLKRLAERIRRTLGDVGSMEPGTGPFLGRLGGDEFAAILPGNAGRAELTALSRRLIAAIKEPIDVDGQHVSVGACVGIASYPADAGSAEDLLANVDLALYQAKADGPLTHRFFVRALRDVVVERRILEMELKSALDRGQLELFYQPQIDLATRRVLGAEALLRWRHPARGVLTPPDFIDVLETSAIAPEVGERIIVSACEQATRWRMAGYPDFQMSVNLFGRQIVGGGLVASVMGPIEKLGLPPSAIEIEITETTILSRDDAILEPLRSLCKAGVRIAFDDYGTGYASLSLLKNFPLTRLKIDKSFVTNLVDDPEDAAVVQAIIFLARNFNLRVIAEGVETEEQAQVLLDRGCQEAQGFLFGRPVPAAEFEATLLAGAVVEKRVGAGI